jgi:hypothetical protein
VTWASQIVALGVSVVAQEVGSRLVLKIAADVSQQPEKIIAAVAELRIGLGYDFHRVAPSVGVGIRSR